MMIRISPVSYQRSSSGKVGGALALLLVTLAAPAWSQPSCPAGSSVGANTGVTVDTAASDASSKRIHAANWASQTFTVNGSGCLLMNSVTFSALKGTDSGADTGDLTVEIRTVAGGAPGTVLASKVVPKASISTSDYADVTVTLDIPLEIAGGAQYALVLYTTGGSAGKAYRFGMDDGDPYAGGRYCKSEDSGANWNVFCTSGFDLKMSICVSACAGGCVHSQGYWKNHPQAWPVASLQLGSVTYTQSDLLTILNAPVIGNGLVSLSHQLIAAKLNVAAGSSQPAGVQSAIASADSMIGALIVPPIGSGFLAPATTDALNTTLDQYNTGAYVGGPPHCEDDDD